MDHQPDPAVAAQGVAGVVGLEVTGGADPASEGSNSLPGRPFDTAAGLA